MKAGFSKINITPPLGTRMMDVGDRDIERGCEAIHDEIFARALWTEADGEATWVVSHDFCFIGRDLSDRFKGALGRLLDLKLRQIMLAATHSHVGPAAGVWYWADYEIPDRLYYQSLEDATLKAAQSAKDSAREATLWAASGHSALPLNRRLVVNGVAENAPNPGGPTCDALPVCVFKDENEAPICCVFSIAAHPSIVRGWEVSGEYPGLACRLMDEYLGRECALFLQGMGGDSKPRTIAKGTEWHWKASWPEMEETARILAQETQRVIENGLELVAACTGSTLLEMNFPLAPAPSREYFVDVVRDADPNYPHEKLRAQWAKRQIELIDNYNGVQTHAPVLIQALQWGEGLQLVAIGGEPVRSTPMRSLTYFKASLSR